MQVPASLHYTDALYGLAAGTVATGGAVAAAVWRPRWSRVAVLGLAALAGLVAMFVARSVRRSLIDDVSTAAACSVVVAGVAAGIGWSLLSRYVSDRWLTVVVLVSAAGVWAAVPDTETAVSLLAAWLPFAVLVVAVPAAERSARHAAVAVTTCWCGLALVLAWSAAWGASARDASLPGALACFGIALVAVLPRFVTRSTPATIPLIVVHVVAVIAAARWAAFAVTIAGGVLRSAIVVGACGVAVGVLGLISREDEPAHPPPSVPAPHPR